MKKVYAPILACVAAVFVSGCVTTQPVVSTDGECAQFACTVPVHDHSLEMAQAGWTLDLPGDMP